MKSSLAVSADLRSIHIKGFIQRRRAMTQSSLSSSQLQQRAVNLHSGLGGKKRQNEFLINFHRNHHVPTVDKNVTTIKINSSWYYRRCGWKAKMKKLAVCCPSESFSNHSADFLREAKTEMSARRCVCASFGENVVNKARCLFIQSAI